MVVAVVVFFVLPSHDGTMASLLIAGLLLAWTQSWRPAGTLQKRWRIHLTPPAVESAAL